MPCPTRCLDLTNAPTTGTPALTLQSPSSPAVLCPDTAPSPSPQVGSLEPESAGARHGISSAGHRRGQRPHPAPVAPHLEYLSGVGPLAGSCSGWAGGCRAGQEVGIARWAVMCVRQRRSQTRQGTSRPLAGAMQTPSVLKLPNLGVGGPAQCPGIKLEALACVKMWCNSPSCRGLVALPWAGSVPQCSGAVLGIWH